MAAIYCVWSSCFCAQWSYADMLCCFQSDMTLSMDEPGETTSQAAESPTSISDTTSQEITINLPADGNPYLYSGSNVMKNNALLLMMAYILQHKLTSVAVSPVARKDLLQLINVLVLGCVPASSYLQQCSSALVLC